MLMKATIGKLPWQNERDRGQVHLQKIRARTKSRASFLAESPPSFKRVLNRIDLMFFSDEPQYNVFIGILEQICVDHAIKSTDAYDWESERFLSFIPTPPKF